MGDHGERSEVQEHKQNINISWKIFAVKSFIFHILQFLFE